MTGYSGIYLRANVELLAPVCWWAPSIQGQLQTLQAVCRSLASQKVPLNHQQLLDRSPCTLRPSIDACKDDFQQRPVELPAGGATQEQGYYHEGQDDILFCSYAEDGPFYTTMRAVLY